MLTFAYFSIASHVLSGLQAKRIDVLWTVMFVIISVIYRPTEQLLSRTIADRRARGHTEHSLRVPIAIQFGFALVFLIAALALRGELVNHLFNRYNALYDVLIVGTLAYAASYFARGWLAGHEYFALYGGLVLMEALSRVCFVLAVALGLASGQLAVALGIAAAPVVSLIVVPAAFARRSGEREGAPEIEEVDAALAGPGAEGVQEAVAAHELSVRRGSHFALVVSGIMLAEQVLLNAAVLTVDATSVNRALAGVVFNVLLIARAPLQLFQAIQTSLLPHLTGLEATAGHDAFARAIRITVVAIARVRARGRARAAHRRSVRHAPPVRAAVHLQPLRPCPDRCGHGPASRLRRAQPSGARARPRARRRGLLGTRGGGVLGLDADPGDPGPAPAGRARLRRRHRSCSR